MIVDDDPNNVRLLQAHLAAEGYETMTAFSGEDCLDQLRGRLPDLILLDIMMPGLDGFEVAQRLKADARTDNIPIIMITALEDRKSKIRALEAGAEEFLNKPVDHAELLMRTRNLLRLKEYHDLLSRQNEILEQTVRERTAALAASEEKFRNATETARDAIIIVDGEGGIVREWNAAAEAIFGYGREEILDRGIHEFLPAPHLREVAQRGMEQFARTGIGPAIGQTLELTAQHKDGHEFPVELSLSAMRLHGKWHATGIVRDITERKRAEQALAASEDRYRQLFENMGSGVAIYRPDAACETFVFTSVNRAVERIERVRREEVLGRSVEEVFPGVSEFSLLHVLRRVCRSGEPEHHPATLYLDERISGWRENYVYRLDSGEVVAVYDDVTARVEQQERIERLNRALRTLSACNIALVHAQTEEELFRTVCRHIVEIGGYLLAWVEYPGEVEGGSPRFGAHFGDEAAWRCHAELALTPEHADRCLSAIALRTRETQVCNDLMEMPKCAFDTLRKVGVAAALALPLLNNGEVYGVLTVFSPAADVFGAEEIKLVEELAGDLAFGVVTLRTGVERDRAVEERERYEQRLHASLTGVVAAMAATLEMRDPYTAGHQRRVAGLAAAIARELGLEADRIEGLHLAGLVHDLGKISVPAEILSKPSRLSDIEFRLIQAHAEAGYEILKDVEFPWPIADIVRQHHERLDGSGYPQGLKGDRMLQESKIMAVADVVEAISSHRPYRPALGIDAGLAEIARGRGAIYDADAVDACVRLFRDKGFAFE